MAICTQSQGFAAQLAINGQAMEFLTIRGGQTTELVDNTENAIRGILDHPAERVTQGLKRIKLDISMEPSPSELDVLLPLIGTTESSDVFTLTDDFSGLGFAVIVDRVAKVHTYAECIVDSAVFRGQKGNRPVRLDLSIIGTTAESEAAAGSFSATALDADHNYAFFEGVLTLESAARSFDRFALAVENNVFASFNNSQTAESACPTDRAIWFACSSPYDTTDSVLYTNGIADAGGAGGTLKFTRGDKSTLFTMANLKLIGQPPDILGKQEIRLDQFYRVYKSGSTAALVVTHDNTAA